MLTTSLMLLSSETRLTARDLRVDPRGVLDVRVSSNSSSAVRIGDRLRQESIVENLAAVSRAPLYGGLPALKIAPTSSSPFEWSYFNMISPEYFELMRMPLLGGRNFSLNEANEHAAVAIVSEATARHLWPNESPLGRELRIDANHGHRMFAAPAFTRATVIGVTRDVVNEFGTSEVDSACVYFPLASRHAAVTSLLVRARGDTTAAKLAIEQAIKEVAPGQADLVVPLEDVVQATIYPFKAAFWVGSSLAVLAMVLVISGIYGVLSFMVSHRQKEIGVRLALGASKGDVVSLILGQSIRLALLGTGLGMVTILAVVPVLAHNVTMLRPFEPLPYAIAAVLILMAVAVAGFVPSRRAAGLDPAATLRNE